MKQRLKQFITRFEAFLNRHQDRWYFLPASGVFFLGLLLFLIFVVNSLANSPSDQELEPSPSPIASPSPSPSSRPSPSPETLSSPLPSSKPKVTPTPSPSPSPSPITEEKISIDQPSNHQNLSQTDIPFSLTVQARETINRVELIINGASKKIWDSPPYSTTLALSVGKYEIEAKAFLEGGRELKSSRIYIGVGGVAWDQPEPTPTPTPTPSPTPTPTPSPTPTIQPE